MKKYAFPYRVSSSFVFISAHHVALVVVNAGLVQDTAGKIFILLQVKLRHTYARAIELDPELRRFVHV